MWNVMRSRLGGWLLGGLFAILIIEMVLFAPGILDPVPEEPMKPISETSQNESAAQTMVGINVVEIREQKKDWELWSEKAVSQKGEGDLELEKVRIKFFGPEGIEYLVTGAKGSVEGESKNMQIIGHVEMESSNGYHFQTENMNYAASERILKAPAAISVRGPIESEGGRLNLSGVGMEANLSGETMRILTSVVASKKIPQRGGAMMNIKAGSALLSSRNKEISFENDVNIQFQDVKVKGPTAKFVYDQTGRNLRAIELDGGVKVSDWDKFATSDSVKLDLEKNQYVFKGRPRVVQDADELFGDEITFLDGGKKVKVKNARVRLSKERMEETK